MLSKIDLLKSFMLHSIILISIIITKVFHAKSTIVIEAQYIAPKTESKPIKASLIDPKEVQLAVKKQADKEKKMASLASNTEKEAKKIKEEKKILQEEQEKLKQAINKFKQQQQEIVAKEEAAKKKTLENLAIKDYYNKMYTRIINNRKITNFLQNNLECKVKIKLLANGQLALVKLIQSSGNKAYDALSEQAIYKSVPFEMPTDPKLKQELVNTEHVFIFEVNN